MNMLVLYRGEAPVIQSICDCTDHKTDGKRKMLNILESFLKRRWKSGIHYIDLQTVSSLMEQQMSKKLGNIVHKLSQTIIL